MVLVSLEVGPPWWGERRELKPLGGGRMGGPVTLLQSRLEFVGWSRGGFELVLSMLE